LQGPFLRRRREVTRVYSIHSCLLRQGGLLFLFLLVSTQHLTAQSLSPLSPAKEYIYLGDRLLAVDSPPAAPPAPTSLAASPANSTTVHLAWTAPPGASIAHYEVERRSTLSGAATILTTTGTGVSYDDGSLNPGTTYLYRVRSVDSNGQVSAF